MTGIENSVMDQSARESSDTTRLLERLRTGDRAAFDELCAQYRAELGRFVERRMDRALRQRVDASDVLQDAQIEAFRRIDDYLEREPMPFGVWLKRTVYEQLLMLRRKHVEAARRSVGNEVALPEQSSLLLARRLFAAESTPSRQVGRRELSERLHAAIAQLSEIDREILLMRNLDELPYDEIAGILDVDPAAARKRHGRAVLRLHKILTDDGLTGSQL